MPTPLDAVSVVVVNHDGAEALELLLESLAASEHRPLEVIVVDNASTDGSGGLLAARADVHVVSSPVNLGFGRGCNLGAQHARGDLLLFANPDLVVEPDTVGALVRGLRRTPGAAVACATLLEPGYDRHVKEPRSQETAAMAAALMLVDAAHFARIGGFDPWMFLYWEDTELCYRSWLAGRKVLKVWDAVAVHELGGTGGGHRFSGEQIKNGLYTHLKTRAWRAVLLFGGRMAAKTVIRGIGRRDPGVLRAWTVNAGDLRATLAKRRAVRGTATPEDRARLERLGSEHAYWTRRAWLKAALRGLRTRLASSR
jgi:N-acetylglucosaminyl-diphospho-decaprenol L-rhamnosyltransferase